MAEQLPQQLAKRAPSLSAVADRARQLFAAARGTARLLGEVVVVTVASVREAARSMVLLRRLQARRNAVIYRAGCAALSGDVRRVEPARAELRLIDELIGAVTSYRPYVSTARVAPAAGSAEAPTEESVLLPQSRLRS